jgi:hypothetical protein
MFVIRNTFTARPGSAGKLASQLKDAVTAFQMPNVRVMTDVTGEFNTVIMEFTAESLDEVEKRMQETIGSQMYRERMSGYTELWLTGNRQILRVV